MIGLKLSLSSLYSAIFNWSLSLHQIQLQSYKPFDFGSYRRLRTVHIMTRWFMDAKWAPGAASCSASWEPGIEQQWIPLCE